MKQQIIILFTMLLTLFTACSSGEETTDGGTGGNTTPTVSDRTVLIYISGENTLSSYINDELQELKEGSKGLGNNTLAVYIDAADASNKPYIVRIKEGEMTDTFRLPTDPLSSDPEVMRSILEYTSTHFPAQDYGLVLWGHASGWVLEDSIATAASRPLKGYGIDSGKDRQSNSGTWINMATLAKVLCQWGQPLKFIFADCCQFQCIESAFELRNATEYIIGSPAEIPGVGAPYNTLTKAMFERTDSFYKDIVDRYHEQKIPTYYNGVSYNGRTPLSVIKTAEVTQLALVTHDVLGTFLPMPGDSYPDMSDIIYYRGNISLPRENVMYDMNDFLLHYADSAAYHTWKGSLDRVVVYKQNASEGWLTDNQINPKVFKWMTDERYGGISMFVPQDRAKSWYASRYNQDIRKTAWYWAAGLSDFGW